MGEPINNVNTSNQITPKPKIWKTIIIILVVIIIIALVAGYFIYKNKPTDTYLQPTTPEELTDVNNDLNTSNSYNTNFNLTNSDIFNDPEYPKIQNTLASAIQYGQTGHLQEYFELNYYTQDLNKILGLSSGDEQGNLLIMLGDSLKETLGGIDYNVVGGDISGNNAILVVSAKKNGVQKEDRYFYFIKINDTWLINSFGWNHPPNGHTETSDECYSLCESEGLFSPMFDPNNNECTCYVEPPAVEDLSYLDIAVCEESGPGFTDGCYLTYAQDENAEYCKKVSSMNRRSCYESIALRTKDVSICSNLWNDKTCIEKATS